MESGSISINVEDTVILKAALRHYIEKKEAEGKRLFGGRYTEVKANEILRKIENALSENDLQSVVAPKFSHSKVACV